MSIYVWVPSQKYFYGDIQVFQSEQAVRVYLEHSTPNRVKGVGIGWSWGRSPLEAQVLIGNRPIGMLYSREIL